MASTHKAHTHRDHKRPLPTAQLPYHLASTNWHAVAAAAGLSSTPCGTFHITHACRYARREEGGGTHVDKLSQVGKGAVQKIMHAMEGSRWLCSSAVAAPH